MIERCHRTFCVSMASISAAFAATSVHKGDESRQMASES